MTKGINATVAGCVVASVLFALPANGVEVLSTEELAAHCAELERKPNGEDAIFCIRYIQGFIDGAVATDERVTRNVVAEYEREETFTERAVKTRIGNRLSRFGPSVYAEFCLGAPVPLREVVDAVAKRLADAEQVSALPQARRLVYATLQENYPCQADGG